MKSRLLYAALGALALTTPVTAQTNPTVYGSVVFGHEWEDMEAPPYGLYSMPADNGNAIKLEVRNDAIKANGGGVYVDGRTTGNSSTSRPSSRTAVLRPTSPTTP